MRKQKIKVFGLIEIYEIDAMTKRILRKHSFKNMLVTSGLKLHQAWSAGIPPLSNPVYNVDSHITHIAVGDDSTPPAISQTALGNELLKKEIYPTPDANCGIDLEGNNTTVFKIFIDESECNGEILREIALFSESQATTYMVSRFLCGNLTKTSALQFLIKYRFVYSS